MPSPQPPAHHTIAGRPGALWRFASMGVMGLTAILAKGFMYCLNDTRVSGLDGFLGYLDKRRGPDRRRGLLTVSNHVSVLDDPLMWSVLPLRTVLQPSGMRWSLGAHDICFQNTLASTFFSLGQVLPTYRLQHSNAGGPFQASMAQAIDLLSGPRPHPSFGAPGSAAYIENDHHCWLHVFPEGRVIQQPANNEKTGYFKWGVSRLILESDPAPDLVPIFMQGLQHIMPEDRGWPRWAPRIGVPVRIAFGMPVNIDERFSHHRSRWRRLVQGLDLSQRGKALHELPDVLKYGEEACDIRMRVASDVKMHVTELAHHIEGAAGRGER